jgi:hypothetical protein
MTSFRWTAPAFVIASLTLTVAACGGGSAPEAPTATSLEANFDVTAHDDVVVLDEAMVERRLVSSDPAVGEYRFDGAAGDLRDLPAGAPLIVPGAGFGIVREVVEDGDAILIRLDEATLADVIQDGTIEWDYDVSWTDFDISYEEFAAIPGVTNVVIDYGTGSDPEFLNVVYRQAPHKAEITFDYAGWEFKVVMDPQGDQLMLQIGATLKVGDAELAAISGEGWMSGFNYASTMDFSGGETTNVSTDISGLHGEMELRWAAYRTPQHAVTEIVKLNIPLGVPIPIGGPFGIPFTVRLKAAVRIVPELSAADSSSGGSWKVTYSSSQGFDIDPNASKPTGKLSSSEIGTSGDTVTAGRGPAGWGLGVEFPRFELGILGLDDPFAFITVDTYSTSLWTPGTLLTSDIPPCQYGYTKFSAIAGTQLKVLGLQLKDQFTLWEKQINVYLDGKECTLDGS